MITMHENNLSYNSGRLKIKFNFKNIFQLHVRVQDTI